jgi:hypothetical protein
VVSNSCLSPRSKQVGFTPPANSLVSDPRKQVWSQGQQVASNSGSVYGHKRLGTWRSRSFGDEARSWDASGRCWFGVHRSTSNPEDVQTQNVLIHKHWLHLSLCWVVAWPLLDLAGALLTELEEVLRDFGSAWKVYDSRGSIVFQSYLMMISKRKRYSIFVVIVCQGTSWPAKSGSGDWSSAAW